jgi:hypothetical protein
MLIQQNGATTEGANDQKRFDLIVNLSGKRTEMGKTVVMYR